MYWTVIPKIHRKGGRIHDMRINKCVLDTWALNKTLGFQMDLVVKNLSFGISFLCVNQFVANWLGGQVGHNQTKNVMFAEGGILMLESFKPTALVEVGFCFFQCKRRSATSTKLDTKKAETRVSLLDQVDGGFLDLDNKDQLKISRLDKTLRADKGVSGCSFRVIR